MPMARPATVWLRSWFRRACRTSPPSRTSEVAASLLARSSRRSRPGMEPRVAGRPYRTLRIGFVRSDPVALWIGRARRAPHLPLTGPMAPECRKSSRRLPPAGKHRHVLPVLGKARAWHASLGHGQPLIGKAPTRPAHRQGPDAARSSARPRRGPLIGKPRQAAGSASMGHVLPVLTGKAQARHARASVTAGRSPASPRRAARASVRPAAHRQGPRPAAHRQAHEQAATASAQAWRAHRQARPSQATCAAVQASLADQRPAIGWPNGPSLGV